MEVIAIIGGLLMLGSGANLNGDVSAWAMILQFLIGSALFVPGYIKFIKEVTENEETI